MGPSLIGEGKIQVLFEKDCAKSSMVIIFEVKGIVSAACPEKKEWCLCSVDRSIKI